MRIKSIISFLVAAVMMAGCSSPEVPKDATAQNRQPNIFPDYKDVVIPPNIAPLNFQVNENEDQVVVKFEYTGGEMVAGGKNGVVLDEDEWKAMLSAAKGKDIVVTVYTHLSDSGRWQSYKPFTLSVAEEEIDPYISYRVIPPSYVAYEMLSINQRNITNFDEKVIYCNMLVSDEHNGQCINCHSYQNYHTSHMQFHMRQAYGGTIITQGDDIRKVNMKIADATISSGVYPAWHPTLNLIAYSTNNTGQAFHTMSKAKIEVEDAQSDLILYDVDKNTVMNIENSPEEFESYPAWTPTGDRLYYVSAHFEFPDTMKFENHEAYVIKNYRTIKYKIYSKSFDRKSHKFGPRELVYDATYCEDSLAAPRDTLTTDTTGLPLDPRQKSATLPRISPDGRYLLFSQGDWGCFHIWHPEADLYMMDLQTKQVRKLENVNSRETESYHSWSSNGRWIILSSRRDDGNYTRLYIAYFDKQGKAHKAFELPQKDPGFYTYYMRSYNIPEFMVEPVTITPQQFAEAALKDAQNAEFKGPKRGDGKPDATTGASAKSAKAAQNSDGSNYVVN